jgi:DNA (cytosine-5)-methyltransferase 1
MAGDSSNARAYCEFFAGGGLARLGLGAEWRCLLANDIDPEKARAYQAAHGSDEMQCGDVWTLKPEAMPPRAHLAWASFPCQDLSLAGGRGGLNAPRSGAFWGFWRLIEQWPGRPPAIIALENVSGLLTSHGGADFAALIAAFAEKGYRAGAVVMDAALFTPQSRPRVFVIAARAPIPSALTQSGPGQFHTEALTRAVSGLSQDAARAWVWWRLPSPPLRNTALIDVLEPDDAMTWRSAAQTKALLALMSPRQKAQIETVRAKGGRQVGAVFRRIRVENGVKVQRAEARFDGLAGCLRTPAGGSSRQTVLVIENDAVRSRLLSPRECARLMGVNDDYPLPATATAALHLMGDAVAAPVVRWLSAHLLIPLADARRTKARAA